MKPTVNQIIKSAEAKASAHAPVDDIRYWIMFAALLETELIIMEIEGGGDAYQGPTAAKKRP